MNISFQLLNIFAKGSVEKTLWTFCRKRLFPVGIKLMLVEFMKNSQLSVPGTCVNNNSLSADSLLRMRFLCIFFYKTFLSFYEKQTLKNNTILA